MHRLIKTSLWLLALTLLIGGCAVKPILPTAPNDRAALAAAAHGDYATAAREYQLLAASQQLPPAARQRFRIEAAAALLRNNQPQMAVTELQGIDESQLVPVDVLRMHLLGAQAWLALHNADQTLMLLSQPLPADAPTAMQSRYHLLRAQALSRLGNHLEAAHEYSMRDPLLSETAAITANQQQLWNELTQLSAPALHAARVTLPLNEFSGWLALAEIGKQYQLGRSDLQKLIAQWHTNYPNHPAQQPFIDGILQRSAQLLLRPKQIALLLPLSGRFAAAGAALRDGVLAAYYNTAADRRIDIRIYNVANPDTVQATYDQAVHDGADFVIGPLSKESVAALLSNRTQFPTPTLVLNTVDTGKLPDNVYQFSLAPESEAKQVAEHAWQLGYSKAAVLVPDGDWGARIEQAFRDRWQSLGGVVTSEATYDSSKNDYSVPLRALLNIDLSRAREQRLESVLGEKLAFQPRRRKDIDFVFLAAFPRQARLIRPQLKFHHAADLPILATSHVYSGVYSPTQDRDMDGIVFGDMPWVLNPATQHDALRTETHSLQLADNSLQRLVAMGIDAYDLIPVLRVLQTYPFERFHGETGLLQLDSDGRLHRQLTWARFALGVPRVIETATAPSVAVPAANAPAADMPATDADTASPTP